MPDQSNRLPHVVTAIAPHGTERILEWVACGCGCGGLGRRQQTIHNRASYAVAFMGCQRPEPIVEVW